MKRCVILSLLIIIICSSFVLAEEITDSTGAGSFSEDPSYNWIKVKTNDWNSIPEISSVSFAMLALINHGDSVSGGVSRLKASQDPTYCWPKGDCKVLDSALATLALSKAGEDVTNNIQWLENAKGALNPALSTGNWYIQIEADGNGKCILRYSNNQTQDVNVENGLIDGKVEGVDITGKIRSKVSEKMSVDCSNLQGGGSIIISLLYKTGNNFYILKNEKASSMDLNVANGCYGTTLTSSGCDYLATAYASWALVEMNREILTDAYLESVLETQHPSDELKHALVARINGKENYITFLNRIQNSDGSWAAAGNVYATAWASFALSKSPSGDNYQNGLDFLKRTVSAAGHWNNNLKDTAMALIALHGKDLSGAYPSIISTLCTIDLDCSGGICNSTTSQCEYPSIPVSGGEICDNGIDDNNDELIDCADSNCCSDSICISDPLCAGTPQTSECISDTDCDTGYGYNCDITLGRCVLSSIGCNSDGICDSGEDCTCDDCSSESSCATTETGCTDDNECDGEKCVDGECVAKSGFPLWILIAILFIIILGAGGWFLVKSGKLDNFFSKKNKSSRQPSFNEYAKYKPLQQSQSRDVQPRAEPMKKSKEDLELEKSLKEAEKLLYGK